MVGLECEGGRGGRADLRCRMGRLSTLGIGFHRRHAQGTGGHPSSWCRNRGNASGGSSSLLSGVEIVGEHVVEW